MDFKRIRKKDIKNVLEWLIGNKKSELEGKKGHLKRVSTNTEGRLDSIMNSVFKDENGDYQYCSMIFTTSSLRNEKFPVLNKQEEIDRFNTTQGTVKNLMQQLFRIADKDVKGKETSK